MGSQNIVRFSHPPENQTRELDGQVLPRKAGDCTEDLVGDVICRATENAGPCPTFCLLHKPSGLGPYIPLSINPALLLGFIRPDGSKGVIYPEGQES